MTGHLSDDIDLGALAEGGILGHARAGQVFEAVLNNQPGRAAHLLRSAACQWP